MTVEEGRRLTENILLKLIPEMDKIFIDGKKVTTTDLVDLAVSMTDRLADHEKKWTIRKGIK